MSETRLANVPAMDMNRIVEDLSHMYSTVLLGGQKLKDLPSVMLWGPPGVGKSQGVRQIGDRIHRATGRKVCVTDVRLLLFNPIDLRGIPTANEEKTLAVWLKPKIFQMDEGQNVVNILFLDEISAAPPSVQAAAYQITLDRTIGEHRLPENCIVIAAGNRTTDKSVTYKMPKALANRLLHIQVEGSFTAWKLWAVRAGIHPKVLGFLSFRRDHLMKFNPGSEELAFATPRSWEMVSKLLTTVGEDVDKLYSLIAGLVGVGMAMEFRSWCKVFKDLPRMEDIFDGLSPAPPRETDGIYALCAAMTAYARENRDDLEAIANSITYADKLPLDFATMLIKDYMYLEENYRQKLMRLPEFSRWLATKGSVLNGTV